MELETEKKQIQGIENVSLSNCTTNVLLNREPQEARHVSECKKVFQVNETFHKQAHHYVFKKKH